MVNKIPVFTACLCCLMVWSGCATESEIRTGAVNRFVEDGVYTNRLKGYSLEWPDPVWQYRNYPEFDLTFEHNDGKAQIFITGISGLVRRDYPDGFVDWILNRLQASNVSITSRENITTEPNDSFHINLDCRFMLLSRDQFGVDRRVMIYTTRSGKKWLAAVYATPPEDFDEYMPDAEKLFATLRLISR